MSDLKGKVALVTHAKSILYSPADAAIDHLFPPFTEEKYKALEKWF